MLWYPNESGYLCCLTVNEIENCKMCHKTFKREIILSPFSETKFQDKCPCCGHVFNEFSDIKFNNKLVELCG